jgi:hypothetical protein
MKIDTVFVVGPPRTGTSIVLKCLEKSGYNTGKNLFGHKYKSQDKFFRETNRGVVRLLYKQLRETSSLEKPIRIGKPIVDEINKFWKYAILYQIEAIKDPLFYEIFGVYWNCSELFRKQKIIWMHRDPVETAKSAVRLKYISNVPPHETLTSYTVGARLKKIYDYNNVHEMYFSRSNGINVYFEDLLSDPEKVKYEMSGFLGRGFDTSLIAKSETYSEKGTPQ